MQVFLLPVKYYCWEQRGKAMGIDEADPREQCSYELDTVTNITQLNK